MEFTTRLGLNKPDSDPETGDFVDVDILNSNFDKLDEGSGFTPCLSTSRPAGFQGQAILETDTGKAYVYGGSAWLPLLIGGAQFDANVGIGTAPHSNPLRRLQISGSGVGGALSQVLLRQTGSATGSRALSTMGGSDTQDHWWVDFDGSMQWSSGLAGGDITVKRSSAGVLDVSTGSLTVNGVVAGTPGEIQKFAATGTWTKHARAKRVRVRLVGAGGSGGGSATSTTAGLASKGGGGGGGCYAEKWFDASALTATVAVTVGVGPTGVAGAAGSTGGTTSFGAFLSAAGGLGGTFSGVSSAVWGANGGVGGSATTGTPDLSIIGLPGHMGFSGPGLGSGGAGGSSALGGGAGGTNLGSGNNQLAGINATGYGGGGGGAITSTGSTATAAKGGDGGDGYVIVESYF